MTIKQLHELCKHHIDNGNGDRLVILCVNDDEFYSLENSFFSPVYNCYAIFDWLDENGLKEDEVMVLN